MVEPQGPWTEWTDADLNGSLVARFERQAARVADRPALRGRTESLTYAALDRRVNRIAHAALALRGEQPEPMAILVKDMSAAIAAILAGYKAAKISLHLDPTLPPERLRLLLEDSGAGLLVSAGALVPLARRLASEAGIPPLDLDGPEVAAAPEERPGLSPSPDAPAHIIYTSGSTGRPNGVVCGHRGTLWGVRENSRRNRVTEHDRILLVASPGTGQGITMLQPLLNGAALFPFDIETEGLPALRDWIREEGITTYHSVPAVFRSLVKAFRPDERFPALRLIRLGGDTIRREDVELFQRHFHPPCLLRVGYSSTESGTIATHFLDTTTPIGDGPVPVGRPGEELEVRLLDDDGREVPAGEVGEIAVRCERMALGYWRRDELTRERFLPDPDGGPGRIFKTGDVGRFRPDGLLEHLGRKDFQVKIRGFRVETGEVAAALRKLPGVGDAVVAAPPSPTGEKRLVAYVVWNGAPLPLRAVRAALSKVLPDYMVPSALVSLPRLPLTPRGKVDLRALPAPPPESGTARDGPLTAPRDDVERELAAIWARLLRRRPIDVKSDFFELGGDSLLAVELFAEIERRMGRVLPLSVFAEAPTIELLAAKLREAEPSRWPVLVPIQPFGSKPPFFCVHTATGEVLSYRALGRRLGPDRPVYGLRCERLPDALPRFKRTEEMATQYIEAIRTIQPEGPYHLGGLSGGAFIAFEMAQQLAAAGESVASLILLDPPSFESRDRAPDEKPDHGLRGKLHSMSQWTRFYWTKLRLLEGEERTDFIREKTAKLVRRAARGKNPFAHDEEALADGAPPGRDRQPPDIRHKTETYFPKVYPGRATIILALYQPLKTDRIRPWRSLVSGGLDVRIVPGFHAYIVEEPFVRVLAPVIEDCLSGGREAPAG